MAKGFELVENTHVFQPYRWKQKKDHYNLPRLQLYNWLCIDFGKKLSTKNMHHFDNANLQ